MDLTQQRALEVRMLSGMIMKCVGYALEKRLSDKGIAISRLQFGILHLISHENYTISELSKKMMLDPSTLVPSVDALEEKGLVKRERDPNDRRRYPLLLTDAGQTIVGDLHVISPDDPLLLALAQIGETDSEHLRTLLRKVIEQMPDGETMLEEMESRIKPTNPQTFHL